MSLNVVLLFWMQKHSHFKYINVCIVLNSANFEEF